MNDASLVCLAPVSVRRLTDRERFERRVWQAAPDECWLWMGAASSSGYGSLKYNGRTVKAHRLAAFLAGMVSDTSRPPKGSTEFLRHTCANRMCCNPRHLRTGPAGGQPAGIVREHAHGNARFTMEQAKAIRARVAAGERQIVLARELGCGERCINLIVSHRTYREPPEPARPARAPWPTGAAHA